VAGKSNSSQITSYHIVDHIITYVSHIETGTGCHSARTGSHTQHYKSRDYDYRHFKKQKLEKSSGDVLEINLEEISRCVEKLFFCKFFKFSFGQFNIRLFRLLNIYKRRLMRRLKFRDFQEIFKLRAGYVALWVFFILTILLICLWGKLYVLIIMFEEKCHGAIKV
jgi:hypothetical protein